MNLIVEAPLLHILWAFGGGYVCGCAAMAGAIAIMSMWIKRKGP